MTEKAKLLVVDDEEPLRKLIREELTRSGNWVDTAESGEAGLAKYREQIYNVVLLDIRMPGMGGIETLVQMRRESTIPEIIMLTGHGTIESAVQCIKFGAHDYLTKPVQLDELEVAIERAAEKNRLRLQNISLKLEVQQLENHKIVGRSAGIQKVLRLIARLGSTEEHVLVHGESGTGKELVARAVHEASPRAGKPFVVVNCGRLNVHTAESELFGHMQGAFTGAAKSRAGLFELANTGTLFLDEVSEMPLDVQVKLLRVLETQTFRRLGGTRDITVDVRCVFASNRNLAQCAERGSFREDLYHRINLLPIELPPLRDRKEDIPLLVRFFLNGTPAPGKEEWGVAPEALAALLAHPWPGNVRELSNTVRRACILAQEPLITPDLLPFQASAPLVGTPVAPGATNGVAPLWAVERDHIRRTLEVTGGNKSRTAQLLEIDRKTLYAKIDRYDLGT